MYRDAAHVHARLKAKEWRRKNPEAARRIDKRAYLKNKPRILAYAKVYCKQWRQRNRERFRLTERARRVGITREALLALYKKQRNRCAICGRLERDQRLHLDHDHNTQQVRGLICRDHNVALVNGVTAQMLRQTADYLEAHSCPRLRTR